METQRTYNSQPVSSGINSSQYEGDEPDQKCQSESHIHHVKLIEIRNKGKDKQNCLKMCCSPEAGLTGKR